MKETADQLRNDLPDVTVAVHTHRIVSAKIEERAAMLKRRLAERAAKAAGVPAGAVHRVGRMMMADPKRMQRQMEEDSIVARATCAGLQVEQPTLFDATRDVSDEEYAAMVRADGYGAAIWCRPRAACPYSEPENVALWLAGYDAFAADKAALEQTETKKRGQLAPAG
jgi:ribosome modulation factor